MTCLDSHIAPDGTGDASHWVELQYAIHVRKRRAKNFQVNLGLLVALDGDNLGAGARIQKLAAMLQAKKVLARQPHESIAVFVPTWSIETWLALLSGQSGVSGSQSLKRDSYFRHLWSDGRAEFATMRKSVAEWNGSSAQLPALALA